MRDAKIWESFFQENAVPNSFFRSLIYKTAGACRFTTNTTIYLRKRDHNIEFLWTEWKKTELRDIYMFKVQEYTGNNLWLKKKGSVSMAFSRWIRCIEETFVLELKAVLKRFMVKLDSLSLWHEAFDLQNFNELLEFLCVKEL